MEPPVPQNEGPPANQFEFDSQQNQVIGDLAAAMRWVAAPLIFLGVLYAFAAVLAVFHVFRQPASLFSVIVIALVSFLLWSLGQWITQAAESFQQVVTTGGRDISNMMDALANLRKLFTVLSTFVKIYVVIVVVTLVVTLVVIIVEAFRA